MSPSPLMGCEADAQAIEALAERFCSACEASAEALTRGDLDRFVALLDEQDALRESLEPLLPRIGTQLPPAMASAIWAHLERARGAVDAIESDLAASRTALAGSIAALRQRSAAIATYAQADGASPPPHLVRL